MALSPSLQLALVVALFLSVSAPAPLAASSKATRIRIYIHERFEGASATVASPLLRSPLGGNATFGEPGVIDDELRASPHPGSELVGRLQGFFIGTDLAGPSYLSTVTLTLVFTAGERRGSTLTVQGQYHFDFDGAAVERAVVGGTGQFRMARGYSVMKVVSAQTPETVVFRIDLFVLVPRPGYYF